MLVEPLKSWTEQAGSSKTNLMDSFSVGLQYTIGTTRDSGVLIISVEWEKMTNVICTKKFRNPTESKEWETFNWIISFYYRTNLSYSSFILIDVTRALPMIGAYFVRISI